MVGALHAMGLRVVLDQVYNHTTAHGQSPLSVLDRIVPGYYHRFDDAGAVANSTCCSNTATERAMMGKLMVDAVPVSYTHLDVYKRQVLPRRRRGRAGRLRGGRRR